MSEVALAIPPHPETTAQNRVTELKVSGHLMTLETGLFCVFQTPSPQSGTDGSGLPGVRVSLPPNAASRPDAVSISSFRPDGWLNTKDDAALVRVASGPAQILVTIYQSRAQKPESAPRLQVLRLSGDSQQPQSGPAQILRGPGAGRGTLAEASGAQAATRDADVVAHVQRTGDVGAPFGEWIGKPGSRFWIEGFSVAPRSGPVPSDIEYQAVLGRDWLSPWVDGGKFCGSRGMALPLLGLKIKLKGSAAEQYECSYSATFVDGSEVGPVPAGEACQAASLAPLEAFKVVLTPKSRGGVEAGARPVEAGLQPRPRIATKSTAKASNAARKTKPAERKRR
jgi:hypothetical protein